MFLLIAFVYGDLQAVDTDFNTSHVSINLLPSRHAGINKYISIHLMFLLIGNTIKDSVYAQNFNTSHVSINQGRAGQVGELP